MDKVLERLKREWENNPLQVLAVGSGAVMAITQLMKAQTHRREIRRREFMDRYYGPRRRSRS